MFSLKFKVLFFVVIVGKSMRIIHVYLGSAVILIENDAFGSIDFMVFCILGLFGEW